MIRTIGSVLKECITKSMLHEIKQANELFYENKFSESDGDLHKTCRSSVKELQSTLALRTPRYNGHPNNTDSR